MADFKLAKRFRFRAEIQCAAAAQFSGTRFSRIDALTATLRDLELKSHRVQNAQQRCKVRSSSPSKGSINAGSFYPSPLGDVRDVVEPSRIPYRLTGRYHVRGFKRAIDAMCNLAPSRF
jgi:hypothetical protein